MDAQASSRSRRTAMISATLVVLTLAGHTSAGGSLPNVVGLAIVVLLAVALTRAVVATPRSFAPLLAFLLAGQVLFHAILTLAGGHGSHASGGARYDTLTMIVGHVCAAVLATILLLRADALAERWRRFVRTILGVDPACVAPLERGPASRPVPSTDAAWTRTALRHVVSRRGPPATVQFA